MEEKEQLMEFIEKFFKNLKADVILQGNFLLVSNVPETFQKFYGKKEPYKFVFEEKYNSPDSDLIEKGSYAIKTISSYLENSGQTTLLKINFDLDSEQEIKKRISLPNSKIQKLIPKQKHNFLSRFTFHTIFQYLNEKEKITNDIYVYNQEIIPGDLSSYNIEEGRKEEIKIPDIKESYFLAKDELKKIIQTKTQEVVDKLNERLEKEKSRIENHFSNENREFNTIFSRAERKLEDLEKEGNTEKTYKQMKLIESIKQKTNFQEIEKDKERAIQLEKQKHLLNVNNKLFNTTLIYYPLAIFDMQIINPYTQRIITVSFDPLTEKLNPLFCEHCQNQIKEIYLCSTGHISCKECVQSCESCLKEYCKKCTKVKCDLCSKHICRECSTRCFKCGKSVCKTHVKEDKISKRIYCNKCLRRCERCGNSKEPYSFRRSKKTDAEICGECFRKEIQSTVLKDVFD